MCIRDRYWDGLKPVVFDLLPGGSVELPGNRAWRTSLATQLPKRFAERWLDVHFAAARKQVNAAVLDEGLHQWEITPAGTEGYAKAEVTLGGVDTACLSQQTMAAKDVPGLFVIGEAVDVTGWLGGYNFQWAWSSGWVAGEAM